MDKIKGYFLTALAKMTVTLKDVNIVRTFAGRYGADACSGADRK